MRKSILVLVILRIYSHLLRGELLDRRCERFVYFPTTNFSFQDSTHNLIEAGSFFDGKQNKKTRYKSSEGECNARPAKPQICLAARESLGFYHKRMGCPLPSLQEVRVSIRVWKTSSWPPSKMRIIFFEYGPLHTC